MAKIPIGGSSTHFYTVEARRVVGYDDQIPAAAVVIHEVDTSNATGLTPIAEGVDPDNNGDPNDAGARWLPGETFTDGANGISVRVDGSTATGYTVTINPRHAPPRAVDVPIGSVTINDGASSTRRSTVRLTLSATDDVGVEEMRIRNGGGAWSAWEPYATSKTWTLSRGKGAKTVYVEFKDADDNVSSSPAFDSIRKRR